MIDVLDRKCSECGQSLLLRSNIVESGRYDGDEFIMGMDLRKKCKYEGKCRECRTEVVTYALPFDESENTYLTSLSEHDPYIQIRRHNEKELRKLGQI